MKATRISTQAHELDKTKLDVDAVLARIKELFPESEILWENIFDIRIKRTIATMRKLEARGRPIRYRRLILESEENTKAANSPAKAIIIPCDRGNVIGIVRGGFMTFSVKSEFDTVTKDRLALLFEENGMDSETSIGNISESDAKFYESTWDVSMGTDPDFDL
jgi:hypothetical protein